MKYRIARLLTSQVAGLGCGTICQASWVLVLAIACVASAAAWLYLVAAHGGFWLTSQRLPPVGSPAATADPGAEAGPGLAAWPAVAAVVPARNEAESLPGTLPALLEQDYPGEFRVFLVDDNSEDGTAAIAAELGEKAARDGGKPLTVVAGQPRPDDWAGKVWAMAQGLAAAGRHRPVRHRPGRRPGRQA